MKILIACEESQEVCKAFRELGHETFSCDILPCSGGHPEWHIKGDVSKVLDGGWFHVQTGDLITYIEYGNWDMVLSFPPCTHLAVSGAKHFAKKIADGRQQQGIDFFMLFANANCERIMIENPVGIMSSKWRKPDQIIQPYQFGHKVQKTTCLWLKNLPKLIPTNIVEKGEFTTFKSGKKHPKWYAEALKLPPKQRSIVRSKTFPGVAKAMAEQWGRITESQSKLRIMNVPTR